MHKYTSARQGFNYDVIFREELMYVLHYETEKLPKEIDYEIMYLHWKYAYIRMLQSNLFMFQGNYRCPCEKEK